MSLKGHTRHIGLRHERHLIRGTSPALAPGEARFSSYYLPSLPAGEYSLAIDQTISTPTKDPPKKADPAIRKFEVLAPEWALSAASNGDSETTNSNDEEAAVVLSVFPASGQTAPTFRTLPHMVLRDAQLPWVRTVSEQEIDDNLKINCVPWFALVVFSADELELDADQASQFFGKANASINDTLGWDLTVNDIEKAKADGLANFIPVPPEGHPDRVVGTKTSLIAVKAEVFRKLFPPKLNQSTFDVTPYRFMSHVRTVPTDGTLSAGIVEDMDHDPKLAGTQTLSVVVSHRLGPTNVQVPTPVLAHLVSLQGIDGKDVNVLDKKTHVLMTSLFSWTYTALPPDAPDVVSMLRYLGSEGKGLSVLRTDILSDPTVKFASKEEELVTKRQRDGFNIVRHRVVTGEQTVAMYRGPLTPTRVPYPLHEKVSFQSNFGTDLQILDPNLGLMDISYASAWQLGKTLAMADPAFTAALSRLRTSVHRDALDKSRQAAAKALRVPVFSDAGAPVVKTRLSVFSDQNPRASYMPKREIKSDVVDIVGALNSINETVHKVGTSFTSNRWRRRAPDNQVQKVQGQEPEDLMSLRSPHIYYQMFDHALFSVLDDANGPNEKGPYNYHTIPNNTDYAVIQEWVLDRLHLSGIPAHYYVPDPSYVPEETLRFFHIDANWMDALVDGALSLANHLASAPNEDYCRSALKEALNRYLKTPTVGSYKQQIPAYGFIMRSKLLVQFPDIAVKAEFKQDETHTNEDWDKVKPLAPILVQRRLGPDMMLVLTDREPPNLTAVTFTLPAHQQTFIAAFQLSQSEINVNCKRIYATGADAPLPEPDREARQRLLPPLNDKPLDTSILFDWEGRTLKIEEYAKRIHENLKKHMKDNYLPLGATSAVFSLQLNEPIYSLKVTVQKPEAPKSKGEDLESWTILHEQTPFCFHPPAFPKEEYKPITSLASASITKMPSYPATRLKIDEAHALKACLDPGNDDHDYAVVGESDMGKQVEIPPSLDEPVYPTDQPIYHFKIFPIGRREEGFIPANNDRPIDLVFSIVRDKFTIPSVWGLRILRWDLTIKIGNPKTPPTLPPSDDYTSPRALLRNDMPDGPPPVMLSNLRYNVLIQKWDMTENQLLISIVPRSKWGVHLQDTPDASFLLPMANVFPWEIPKGKSYTVEVILKSQMTNANEENGVRKTYNHTQSFKLKAA